MPPDRAEPVSFGSTNVPLFTRHYAEVICESRIIKAKDALASCLPIGPQRNRRKAIHTETPESGFPSDSSPRQLSLHKAELAEPTFLPSE